MKLKQRNESWLEFWRRKRRKWRIWQVGYCVCLLVFNDISFLAWRVLYFQRGYEASQWEADGNQQSEDGAAVETGWNTVVCSLCAGTSWNYCSSVEKLTPQSTLKTSLDVLKHREKRMEQERELLEKKIEWLTAELKTKTEELLNTEKDKGSKILELQANLKSKTEQVTQKKWELTTKIHNTCVFANSLLFKRCSHWKVSWLLWKKPVKVKVKERKTSTANWSR